MNRRHEQFNVQFTDVRRSTVQDVVGGREFWLDYRAITDALLLPLTSRMVDLIRIASSVYFIDRLVKRDRKQGPDAWPRKISCSIEVQDVDFWSTSVNKQLVLDAVRFVSGDEWSVEFQNSCDDQSFHCEWQRSLFPSHLGEYQRVCLYSGGLDSAAGLAKRLLDEPDRTTLAITIRHRADIGNTVTEQLRKLAQACRADIRSVIVPFEMSTPRNLNCVEEVSQRARAFLFVGIGGVVAGATGNSQLELYESGVGAVNVPLLAGMTGSQATRSAHPSFLNLMSQLLSAVSNSNIEVILPFKHCTKSEIVKVLATDKLQEVAESTISCAHFPVRLDKGGTWKSCGICPACIFRRVALHAAGIEEGSNHYQHDLFDPVQCRLGRKKLRYLLAFLLQVDSLRVLDEEMLPMLIDRHLRSTGLLPAGHSQEPYLNLFRNYRAEWRCVIEHARKVGCEWANRIDLPSQAA